MKVYIVEYRQGSYDDVRETIPAVFASKSLADKYVDKLKSTFKKCYDYYKSVYDIIDKKYDVFQSNDESEERLIMATKWCYYHERCEKFETPYCFIIEKEVIGFKP